MNHFIFNRLAAAAWLLDSRELGQGGDGQRVRVAGQNVMHQAPPTAKGFTSSHWKMKMDL
jgi:hypothetical protein